MIVAKPAQRSRLRLSHRVGTVLTYMWYLYAIPERGRLQTWKALTDTFGTLGCVYMCDCVRIYPSSLRVAACHYALVPLRQELCNAYFNTSFQPRSLSSPRVSLGTSYAISFSSFLALPAQEWSGFPLALKLHKAKCMRLLHLLLLTTYAYYTHCINRSQSELSIGPLFEFVLRLVEIAGLFFYGVRFLSLTVEVLFPTTAFYSTLV